MSATMRTAAELMSSTSDADRKRGFAMMLRRLGLDGAPLSAYRELGVTLDRAQIEALGLRVGSDTPPDDGDPMLEAA
jgi:hypothetical protein